MESDEDEDDGYFGQEQVPLTDEIKEILEEYPDGQIFKEIIQNADDAKATSVKFFIDERSHGQQHLLHRSLAKFQGPSLLAYNDAVFTDEDWTNIQKLKRSDKRSDPFKVGKFGIGFNSVFHVTDLPAIVSGEWLCFMDPQKKIWRGDPGHKYKLKNNKPGNHDSFTPFVFGDPCSLGMKQNYPGTLIRFPLRNERSELSDKLYTTAKLKSIFKALKDDASILLLFLRYIENIEVFMINTNGTVTKLFNVAADNATQKERMSLKDAFFKQVKQFHSAPSTALPFVQYEIKISVHDIELGTHSNHQWMVANWVGSENKEILETSQRVCSLPWLGLAASPTSHCPVASRLSCFLPMPDSEEVNPPLPIYIHGTFGLTKDRRHLKWKTSDMQNDDGALWNDLLLSKVLPLCYAKFLHILRDKCDPTLFYSLWPNVHSVKLTNWRVMLRPLLSLLLKNQFFWSQSGSWVKLQSSVYVVPQINSSHFPQVVINTLIKCGKVVVALDDRVWEAVKFMHTGSYPFTTITPSLVRQALKNNNASYTNIKRAEKLELLQYCLEDNNYNDLSGLLLLPVVNGTFEAFSGNFFSINKFYICDETFLQTRLLANNEAVLVNVEREDSNLHQKLLEIAKGNYTQLQRFTPEAFATILRQLIPFQNGWCCYGDAEGFYNENWLKTFWNWVSSYRLSAFVGIALLPVCNEKNSKGFKVVAVQNKSTSQVIKYNQFGNFYSELITAAGKLSCYLTCTDEFQFLYHSELTNYVHDLNASSLLTIASQGTCHNVVFTHDEARALQHFIFQYPVRLKANQKSVALNLQIFSTLQNNSLCSLQNARCTIAGNSGAMILLDPDCLSRYTPYLLHKPLILSCTKSTIGSLTSVLPGSSWFPTKLQIILNVIIPAIEDNHLTREVTLKITSTLIEYNEYYSLITGSGGIQLINTLKSLKFVPVNGRSELYLPSQVYDPKDHNIQELFGNENAFPTDPFSEEHFTALRELGMKTASVLETSDMLRIAHTICNQPNSKEKILKANNLISFLCTTKGNTLLNTYYNGRPLEQTLRSMQWLPVMVNPPKGYPKCLPWKGASGSQFVSAQHIHASSSSDDHKKLPYIIGSQIKILQHEGSLSDRLIASFKISQNIPLHAISHHFLSLINHKNDIDRDKFNTYMKLLYNRLQIAVLNDSANKEWHILSQSKVVQVGEDKFVLPSLVACSFDENTRAVGKLEPYIYILPDQLLQYRSLFCHIGVKHQIIIGDVFSVLDKIALKPIQSDWMLVRKILKWLTSNFASNELQKFHDKIFVPINSDAQDKLALKPAKEVAFLDEDLQWLINNKEVLKSITKDYYLVHPSISYNMSCDLQLKPLNTMIANTEEYCFEQAGQSEPLTTRLNRILRDYKDTSVIQELLQNADDAGATEVAVYYDTREHDSSNLFFPGMANSYGPALLFYNNAEFTEEDFENITKIAGETKMNKPLKIGKFGVGFCSVYHITDVPSFVSGENFIVFDPTLQCLRKEIKSENNPGIKINFHKHRFLNKSKQLAPYIGIRGFDSKKQFKGTIFRFPLRSKSSKVSKNVYTHEKVQLMFDRVKEGSSKLLMFLNNVERMSFYHSDGHSFTKDFEITVEKQSLDNLSGSKLCKVSISSITESGDREVEEFLIASNSQKLQSGVNKPKIGIASVSIKLKSNDKANKTSIETVRGECFCYLPLHIDTGLPIHISSNFAVMTNRRGIWKADNINNATIESNWNRKLMESVVFQAYMALLLQLQTMQRKGLLTNYSFYSLWPLHLMEINPWQYLKSKFYGAILSSQHALFYSEITKSWRKLSECKFLCTKILESGFNDELQSSLYDVAVVLKLPVVKLPDEIQNIIADYDDDKSFAIQVINEEQFIKYFYDNKTLSKVSVVAKSAIVCASLIVYVNQKHCPDMPELMKNTKCVPCSPDGQSFKKPQDIVNVNSTLAKLFAPKDGMFPHEIFLNRNTLVSQALSQLGQMKSLPWALIIDRAKCVPGWCEENNEEGLNRLTTLIDCIKENCCNKYEKSIERKLQNIAFLPVMKKPDNYPISWQGDNLQTNFLSGPELTAATVSKGKNKINAIFACGSQVPILDTQFMSHPFNHFTPKVLNLLGINQEIQVVHVINQFNELLEYFQEASSSISKEILEYTDIITITIYQYLNIKLKTDNVSLDLSTIKSKPCIWNGKKYLLPSNVSLEWTMNGPYLYKLPDNLKVYISFMEYLGVEKEFSSEILVNAIHEMKLEHKDNVLPSECQNVLRLIIPKLENISVKGEMFLPDEKFVLRTAKELKYNDAPWLTPEKTYLYCNDFVGRKTAVNLGVEPVKSTLLEGLDISGKLGEEFGQEEKLTVRLNNILRDYPRDITFLKEILQNADDARASKLFIMLDKRYHKTEKVISEEWKQLQGPALLFWNDSLFTEEDLIGIQKIGLGNKREDPNKIGQYGIGFNVVYHYTDCPSFITSDRLCILDPHRRYIARERMKPGKMYRDLEKIWEMFPHMKSSFLQNDFHNFSVDIKGGSLFRLPLRLTKEDAEQSEIVQNDGFFELEKLEEEFKEWIISMQEALLFVHHVCEVRFFVINEEKLSGGLMRWKEPNPVILCSHVESIRGSKKIIIESDKTNLTMYNLRLTNKKTDKEERWLIQLGEGNPIDAAFDWNSVKPADMEVRPQHGIATCLNKQHYRGKPFCFLPLPGYTYLPVHIHGQFALHSDRRCLWISSSDNNTSASTRVDYKNVWNEYLIKAIGVSYCYFLTHSIMQNDVVCTKQEALKCLNDYYNLFPILSKIHDEPWKTLANEVYKGLSNLNSRILATLVEANPPDSQKQKNDAKQYSVSWYNLHMPEASEEGHFHTFYNFHLDIWMILKSIGMNLIDTPISIHEQFKKVGIDLPIISKESVLEYYMRFQDNILNNNKLPCNVSSTKFSKVEQFVSFVKYLSIPNKAAKSDGDGEKDTSPLVVKDTTATTEEDITNTLMDKDTATEEDVPAAFSCGFLITADEFIHALSDGSNIINSKNWFLFPNSKNVFLHKTMITECLKCDSLFQVSESGEEYTLIHSVFANNLPSSWNGVTQAALEDTDISWVKGLLKCISEDSIFKFYQQQLLEDFTLIPSDNNVMFSSSSEVLPMKSYIMLNGIESILRKLQVFFVNNDVLQSVLNDIKINLPSLAVPMDILKTVYLISRNCNNLISLDDEELEVLFKTFALISYAPDLQNTNLSVFYIKHLPIFSTIHGEKTNLSSASKVWIWNGQVCKVGISEWICHIQKSSVIFLDPDGPWSLLRTQADYLNISKISLYELYCDYIFPHFNAMNSDMRIEHIKFISTRVYFNCKHESESMYLMSNQQQLALNFIKEFTQLKCIGDDDSYLKNIGSFYDHTQEIFTVFCDEQCFLPKELQDDDIQESLKFFGLRSVPTTTEFLDYCSHVSSFAQISTVSKASKILLKILFQDTEQYQHIYDKHFLQQVSYIPIAIIQTFPKLNAIAKQHLGDCQITNNSDTVELTKLLGSCVTDYKHSTWTCKPLVNLPSCYYYTCSADMNARADTLGISLVPSIDDVVENLANLANTEFADFSRFQKRGSRQSVKISCDLPDVVVSMLECINENVKKAVPEDYDDIITTLRNQLENLNFVPVKLRENGYALVKPAQVLMMDSSSLLPYYPFLHPLEEKLRTMIQLLCQVGVKMSLGFSHIQLFFKSAKDLCKDQQVDVNIKFAVAKAMEELIVLLRKAESAGKKIEINLQPLFLLNEQDVLTECSKLVVFDISGSRLPLPSEFTYLNSLTDLSTAIHWTPEELLNLLPKNVGLKSLKSVLQCEMINSVPVQTPYPCVTTIKQILHSSVFKTAIEKHACYCTRNHQPPKIVTEILTKFQNNLQVEYLADISVKPQLVIGNEIILLPDTICQEFFLQCCGDRYILSLKNTPSSYHPQVFRKMSRHLCLALQLQKTKCFDLPEDDEVPDITSFVCDLLNCGSVFKLSDVIIEHLPGSNDIEQDMEPTIPKLGEIIPDCWHHRLDQSLYNIFMPTEWVGYEDERGKIVYAQILHINDITASSEENMQQFLQQKYTISIGSDTKTETTILKLFKFIYILEELVEEVSMLQIEADVSADTSMQSYEATDRKAIRDAVKAAWSLPEEEKKRAIKRLYLQYHPDKNLGNPHATANFQLLQEEIARMESGIADHQEDYDVSQVFRSSDLGFSSSEWSGLFHQWDRTAYSHRRYRSRDRPRRSASGWMSGGWNIPQPKKECSEAKRWIKQAEYDYEALCGLESLSQNNQKTCAATCFMGHEVAEKALKAGMYAKCGMSDATLKCHNLESPARALMQVGCLADINDAIFLENFYSEPRFPYCFSSPIVPGEKYLSSTAREAFLAATRIYEAMKQLIEDDE